MATARGVLTKKLRSICLPQHDEGIRVPDIGHEGLALFSGCMILPWLSKSLLLFHRLDFSLGIASLLS
jgi:hypothetical protein